MFVASQSWLHDLEQNMRTITVDAYEKLLAQLWWQRVAAKKTSQAKAEIFTWLISTAQIRKMEPGQAHFEDVLSAYTELENEFASDGLKLRKEQLEDMVNGLPGGEGLNMAARWSRDIGRYAAYWPQKQVAAAIKNGASAGYTTYDGLTFFNTGHYVNGVDNADGTFSNLIKPTALGHACKIDSSVTVDAAIENLAAVRAYIASIAMPNGSDPRNLQMKAIIHPPALRSRLVQMTYGGLIAQAAVTGGGGADSKPITDDWALEKPIEAPELGAAFDGSDTSYYILAGEGPADDELGALIYQEREPFAVLYHGPEASAQLARERELQYLVQGRNVVGYGHPYLLFRVDAAD